jgi:hypothetical protein
MQRTIKVLLLSMILGGVGLLVSSTREPWGVWDGFPFRYAYPNPITCLPNPFNGCGFYYDPIMVVLDYLFWFGMAVVGILVVSLLWNHLGPIRSPSQPASDQIPPGKAALTKAIYSAALARSCCIEDNIRVHCGPVFPLRIISV